MKNNIIVKMRMVLTVIMSLLILLAGSEVLAATYYVSPSGDNGNAGSSAAPWKTLSYSSANMSGGDTLILKDGTYTNENNDNRLEPPSGTSGNYTIIKAENDYQATIDGSDIPEPYQGYPLRLKNKSYVQVEGLRFVDGATNSVIVIEEDAHYIKILRCGIIMKAQGGHGIYIAGTQGNYPTYAPSPDHILVEDVWITGQVRYGILAVYNSKYVIVRRAVVRFDWTTIKEPTAGIAFYGPSQSNMCQNCIVLDWNYGTGYGVVDDGIYGAFYNPKSTQDIKYYGSIALNIKGEVSSGGSGDLFAGFASEDGGYASYGNDIVNSISWDTTGNGIRARGTGSSNSATASYTTIGAADYGIRKSSNSKTFNSSHNLFISNSTASAVTASDYDHYESNSLPGYIASTNYSTGDANLQYLPRSTVKGTDGLQVGAVIEKRYGVSGTLWGETGYDQLTDDALWPWPNEDQIKTDFRITNDPVAGAYPTSNDTKRGFAADGNALYGGAITLTSYIWEYLGNSCPLDICTYATPQAPLNLRLITN